MIVLLLISVSLIGLIGALVSSEQGCHWLIKRGVSTLSSLKIGMIEGNLVNGLRLQHLSYQPTDDFKISVSTVYLHWEAKALLQWQLTLSLKTQGILVQGQPLASADGKTKSAFELPKLPINIRLKQWLIEDFSWQGQSNLDIQQIDLSAALTEKHLSLSVLNFDGQGLQFKGHGVIHQQTHLPLNFKLDWLYPLPENQLKGTLSLQGNLEKIQFDSQIKGVVNSEQKGWLKLTTEQPEFALSGHWHNLKTSLFHSESGRFNIQGDMQSYQVQLQSAFRFKQQTFNIKLNAIGQPMQLTLKQLQFTPVQGQIDLTGDISWVKATKFNLKINANQLNPENWGISLPGQITALAQLKGQIDVEQITADINLQQLTGQLVNQPIKAYGQVSLNDQQLSIQSVKLMAGRNHLQINGRLNRQFSDLRVVIDAPDLTTALPSLAGRLQGQLLISGKLTHPHIKGYMFGKQLHYQHQHISDLSIIADYQPQTEQLSRLDLTVQDFQWNKQQVQSLTIRIQGQPQRHHIDLELETMPTKLTIKTDGQWQSDHWQGEIKQFNLLDPKLKHWQLQKPVKLQLSFQSEDMFNLAPGCLVQTKATLCFSGRMVNQIIHAKLHLSDWPLSHANIWSNNNINLQGLLSVQSDILVDQGQLTTDLNAAIQQGQVHFTTKEYERSLLLTSSTLTLHYGREGLQSDFFLGLNQHDYLHAKINAEPANPAGVRVLSGQIQAQLHQLDFIDSLLPQINHLGGLCQVDLTLMGNTQQPRLKGQVEWQSGAFEIPTLGSHFDRINLLISNQDELSRRLKIKAKIHSGEGNLAAQGYLDLLPEEQYPLRLNLIGKNFQISQMPQANIAISPDLWIDKHQQSTQINGTIKLDKAMIEIKELPETAIAPSEDEVIIGADRVTEKPDLTPSADMQIAIEFGQQSYFSGFGFKTQLTGQLTYQSHQHQQQVQGKALMKGATYHAYGQDLSIRQGEFLFNGVADNPWLNIEAVRQADDGVTAILKVSGLLKNPKSQVFTEPAHTESEALAYLITGRSIKNIGQNNGTTLANAALNYGTGHLSWLTYQLGIDEFEFKHSEKLEDSSVKLGKYLNPDLYVGVTMGVFSNTYATDLRYRLSKHFSIRTRAGETQRIELKYHIETEL